MNQENDQLLSFERRRQILEIVNEEQSVSVDELAERFPVSAITIRRDLDKLAEEGLLKRVHGGAAAIQPIATASKYSDTVKQITEDKIRIGAAAAEYVHDGDFIIIESGSTCLALVNELKEKKHLKIVTLDPHLVVALSDITDVYDNRFEIISTGGVLNAYRSYFLGPHARRLLEDIRVDTAFISVLAIDPEAGITTDEVNEAENTRMILNTCTRKRIALVTSPKIGKISFVKVADAGILDEIITNADADPGLVAAFREKGIKVTVTG